MGTIKKVILLPLFLLVITNAYALDHEIRILERQIAQGDLQALVRLLGIYERGNRYKSLLESLIRNIHQPDLRINNRSLRYILESEYGISILRSGNSNRAYITLRPDRAQSHLAVEWLIEKLERNTLWSSFPDPTDIDVAGITLDDSRELFVYRAIITRDPNNINQMSHITTQIGEIADHFVGPIDNVEARNQRLSQARIARHIRQTLFENWTSIFAQLDQRLDDPYYWPLQRLRHFEHLERISLLMSHLGVPPAEAPNKNKLIRGLIETLLNNDTTEARHSEAAQALGRILGNDVKIDRALRQVIDGPSSNARFYAAFSLFRRGDYRWRYLDIIASEIKQLDNINLHIYAESVIPDFIEKLFDAQPHQRQAEDILLMALKQYKQNLEPNVKISYLGISIEINLNSSSFHQTMAKMKETISIDYYQLINQLMKSRDDCFSRLTSFI